MAETKSTDYRAGAVIRLDAVSRRFRVGSDEITAVNDVSLEIDSGDWVALTGVSGSGKSTLLRIIGAIERADSGSVTVDGTDITGLSRGELARYRQGVGFVFQRFHLLAAASALDNVIAPLAPLRVKFDKVARARELLDAVGLSGRERSLPSQLSGGQQQRVAIARALVNRPRLLLADEPTGNLDSATSAEIVELLLALRRQLGMTVLFATHEAALAASAERIITLRDGRITK